MPACQRRDDEQADPAVRQQVPDADLVGVAEQQVHPVLFLGRHAQSPVLHLDRDPGGDPLGAQHHIGVGGGEHRGVLDEFGQQVHDVSDGVTADTAAGRGHDLDPGVLLDLRDRGAEHLAQVDGTGPLAAGGGAAQHGEVLGVAADAGGEVVDVEELLEQVRVLDRVLQIVQERDLPVDEGLQSAREVDEDLDLALAVGRAGRSGQPYEGRVRLFPGAAQFLGEQPELVHARRVASDLRGGRPSPHRARRALAPFDPVGGRAQLLAAAHAGAAQRLAPVPYGLGAALGSEQGRGEGAGHEQGAAGEHGPQPGVAVTGSPAELQREDHRGRTAETGGERGQHGGAYQLGAYLPARTGDGVSRRGVAGGAESGHRRPRYVGPGPQRSRGPVLITEYPR